jgi:hypothetical protein
MLLRAWIRTVNHIFGPFFRKARLSLAVPTTRARYKVDRDFSLINIESTMRSVIRSVHMPAISERLSSSCDGRIQLHFVKTSMIS